MKKLNKILNILLPVLAVGLIIAVWAISAKITNDEFLLPSVGETLKDFFALFKDKEFYTSLLWTVVKSLISFVVSFVIAVLLGIIAKRHDRARRFFAPIISIMRALPTVAVVLLLIVWTNSFIAPIIVTALVVLPTVYTNVCGDLDLIDEKQIEMCKLFKVKERDIVFKVLLPQITPSLLNTVGSTISLNLKLMVAAEVLVASGNSLGNLLNQASNANVMEMSKMLALVLVIIILGLIIEGTFGLLSKKSGEHL